MSLRSNAHLAVLTYHRIGRASDGPPGLMSATPAVFERQMRWLAGSGRAVALDDVLAAVRGTAPLRRDAVLVTFDDAYLDFAGTAWPILRALGIPVTLFVPTAFPADRSRAFWWDRLFAAVRAGGGPEDEQLRIYRRLRAEVKSLDHEAAMARVDELAATLGAPAPRSNVLTWSDLRRLAAEGVTLAPHSRAHPLLDRVPRERLAGEIGGSAEDLARETGCRTPAFAYPGGAVSAAAVAAAADAGVEVAFTTERGVSRLPVRHPLLVPRLNVGRRTSPAVLRAEVSALGLRVLAARQRTPDGDACPAVAYVMSRFPKLSETFIFTEILALEQRGVRVEIYPLLREHQPNVHPEVLPLVERAHYTPFVSPAILASQLHWLRRAPRAYLSALRDVAAATAGNPNFFAGGLAIFPKAAHLARVMQADGITHVHCHFANHPAAAGFVISRLTGLPYSFTAHGSDLHKERRMLPEKVREAAFVTKVSDYNRRVIVAECGEAAGAKVHLVRAGVDTELFAPVPRPGGAPGQPLRIVCVGTLHAVKGQAHLVEACRLLAARGVRFRCRFAGDGPDRAMLAARIAAAGLQDRVELLGGRTRPEIAEELRRADVLVAPSVPTSDGRREGLPVVLVEAMSTGLPVVASRLSGIPELVEDDVTGLLAPPGDAAALAGALARLAADPALRARLGAAGRERILREFDLRQSADWLIAHFNLREAA
jgi:colanic acid/amylovoran biosynthesis glycosyltransferase